MSRVRSPNYPAMSLATAIDRVRTIQKAEGKNGIPREAIANILGFSGLNGASATVVSAIGKYGLLEGAGDGESRVSDLAVRILYPESEEDRRAALSDAATRPVLFREIKEKWPDRPPSDENLRSFLVRKGFGQGALDSVIRFYRETIDIVGGGKEGYGEALPSSERPMAYAEPAAQPSKTPLPSSSPSPSAASLPEGRPFSVAFDGSLLSGVIAIRSAKEIDKLIRVLTAQKAAFEAMEDEPATGEI